MPNATSCPGGRWCERADALLGVEGIPPALSRRPGPAWFCTSRQPKLFAAVRTAASSRSDTAAGRSGSMTLRASAVRCGCCGPSVCGAARTLTAREPRSPKSTSWRGPGQNSPPGPWRGRPTACSISTPRSLPWPTSSACPSTPPGTRSRQRPPGESQRLAD